jgi:protoporphyrinogen oxidase
LKPVDGVQTNPIPSELLTFSNGMRTFAQGLHGRARTLAESQGINFVTRLGRTVSALELVPNGRSNTLRSRHILTSVPTCGLGGAAEQSEFDVVFTSVPIWRAPLAISISQSETKSVSTEDLDAFVRQRFALLDETPSHGLVVVGIGGKDTSPPPQGFGALAPEASPDLLGVLYVHSLAPSHAPEGHFMYRVLLGGDRDPAFVERTDAACVAKAR